MVYETNVEKYRLEVFDSSFFFFPQVQLQLS